MKGPWKKIAGIYRKFSRRERLVFYATTAILGTLAADRLVVAPILSQMASLDRKIKDEERLGQQSLKILIQKNRISVEAKEFAAFSTQPKNPEEEMTSLLKEIESLADKASVSLLYVKPATSGSEATGARKYLASLECEAEMEQVAQFFHSIEGSSKLLKIEKFDIQPKSRESSIARCAVTVSKTVLA